MDTSGSERKKEESERKGALESLDREDLIRKCKGLLGILKSAKKAKDDLTIEVSKLTEKLTEYDTQKQADKECLKTMQMMVDSLTENKLSAANKIADLEKSIKHLTHQLNISKEKLNELEIENEAKNKRIQRLTDENEEQEMDLKRLDDKLAKVSELSQRQTQELLVLEESIDRWKAMENASHKLQQENKELQLRIDTLQQSNNEISILKSEHENIVQTIQNERDNNQCLYDEAKSQLDALKRELDQLKQIPTSNENEKIDILKEQLQHENQQLRKLCEDQACKLHKYKAKVCEFSSKLKEVRHSKQLITETVIDYSNSVTKWQVQISHASKLMITEVNKLSEAKAALELQFKSHENLVMELKATIQDLENRLHETSKSDNISEKYEKLLVEYNALKKDIEENESEIATCNDLTEAKLNLEKQLKSKEDLVTDLKTKINELEIRLEAAMKMDQTSKLKEMYKTLLLDFKSLKQTVQDKDSEISQQSDINIDLEKQLNSSEQVIKEIKRAIADLQIRLEETAKQNNTEEIEKKYDALHFEFKSLQQVIQDKDAEIITLNNLKEVKTDLEKQLNDSEQLVKNLKENIDTLEMRLQKASEQNDTKEIETKYEALLSDFKSLQQILQDKESEIATHNDVKSDLENQLEDSKQLIKELRTTVDDLEIRLQEIIKQNETKEIKEKYELLLIDYKSIQADIKSKNTELESTMEAFEQINAYNKAENEKNSSQIRQMTEDCEIKSQQIAKYQENEIIANKKNNELLTEMRELNDVLKTRGELISSQSTEIEQIKSKLNDQTMLITTLEENLKEKSKQLEQLRNQLDSQSDILSTSTISRADEVARMRDIEDSFEEKYNKLRVLAVKLKKKIAEQQNIIAKLEANASEINSGTQKMSTPVSNQNLISLQKEYDRLLDQIDSMKLEQKQFKSEINQLNQQINKLEDEIKSLRIVNEDLKTTADTNKQIKCALDEQIKADEKQIETLKNDNKNVVQHMKNADNEIIKLKDIIKQKENDIMQKTEEVLKIKSEMSKLKASIKKSNVLNLEVEAYEKSLTEVSQKYDSTVKQLSEAKNEIDNHQTSIKKLTAEIQSLTNQLELEKQNSSEYQQQNELQQIKIKENGLEISELQRLIDNHVKETNQIKIELANLQSLQSENEIEKQKFISKQSTENENNVTKILALEEEVRELRVKLNSTEQELGSVQTDFATYKIRAQAVLRQNQSKDSSSEEELKEEITLLMQAKEDLNKKLAHASEQQRRFESTIDELKGEKANLQERCKKLLQVLDETRQQIDTMQTENRKQMQEQHEALKTQRLQVDTLTNCFKTQIEELQKKHEEEISVLKSTTAPKLMDVSESNLSLAKGAQLTTEQRIELLMMERQDGEGSECTTSVQPRKMSTITRDKHEIIPLDELLNNTFDEEEENTGHDEDGEKAIPKEKFEAQQSRVKHLSTLLSEAEMDVARLTEMNTMLKEELRRQERSTEREKQMQNLEYMKNVIFKFLTINNADERAHLVPVLNIILKLSPDESKTLQSVASGGDGNQSSWSSLLPMW